MEVINVDKNIQQLFLPFRQIYDKNDSFISNLIKNHF